MIEHKVTFKNEVDEFNYLGQRHFGLTWKGMMAQHLDVMPNTVSRWASGKTRIPRAVLYYLRAVHYK